MGRPPSKDPALASIRVRVTPAQYAAALFEATRRGISISELLRGAIPPAEGVVRGDSGGGPLTTSRRA